jgi:2-amino-4-hydroxy-6-hydroxymethyldihydropteridine diphosphokinase
VAELAFVALGSNLGDRRGYLARARSALAALPGCRLLAESDVEETEPIGPVGQGAYLNQMVALETTLEPHALLAALQRIESAEGRVRDQRWGPRTLDLDIVLFGERTVSSPALTVPHPELPRRVFWRAELAQLRERLGGRPAPPIGQSGEGARRALGGP